MQQQHCLQAAYDCFVLRVNEAASAPAVSLTDLTDQCDNTHVPASYVIRMKGTGFPLLCIPCESCLSARLLQEAEPVGDGSEEGALWQDAEEGLQEQAARLSSDLAASHQENGELRERLMVSEATVHAQAEQLKDYRDLLSESLSPERVKRT